MPVHQHSDPFEDRVADELRATGGQFHADPAALTSAGLARGRRLRLRRRAAVVGGAASLALVGVGGALLLPGGGADAEKASVGSTPSRATSAAPVSDQELIGTLEKLLGHGKYSQQSGSGTAAKFGPVAQLVWDDGHGGSLVAVSLRRVAPGSPQARAVTECPDPVYTKQDSCKTSRLTDGSLFTFFQGYVYADKSGSPKRWTADLVTPKGEHVSVSEYNSESEKGSPVTRTDPPLNAGQLKELASAPAWLTAIAAIPGEAPSPEPEETVSSRNVTAVLTGLLPKGVKVVTPGQVEGTEFGYVVVDDGHGKSLVQVNVQSNMGDMASTEAFSGAETLGDGTLVAERKSGGDKGVTGQAMWTVDTLRTDGSRVVISAFNAGTQHEAPTRQTPALSMKQLRAIALDPTWFQ